MSGFEVKTDENLIRTTLWSSEIKELLLDELNAMRFVRILTDFPDGSLINIPSIGEAETADFAEGNAIKYNKLDTGNFQFQFTQYKYSANSMSAKFKRDSYYSDDVLALFAPREHRALMEAVEVRILSRGPAGQTASDLNLINTAAHRFVASGTNQMLTLNDFIRAQYALIKAQVPLRNLVAIVDPSAAASLQQQTNVVNLLTPSPMWQDVVKDGMVNGMQFRFNLYGFDVYISNYLPLVGSETINSVSVTNGVANQFFSAATGTVCPIIGGFREMPHVDSKWNMDLQQWEFLTIAEYDFALFRPENMVTVLSNTAVFG